MLKNVKRILLILTLLLSFQTYSHAQDVTVRHYIVAFDQAVPMYKGMFLSTSLRSTIEQILRDSGLSSSDYLTCMSYSIDMSEPSMDRYAVVWTDAAGEKVSWRKVDPATNYLADMGDWVTMVTPSHSFRGENFDSSIKRDMASLQSMAKQYAIKAAKYQGSRPADYDEDIPMASADETILLMVTDEQVNGTADYSKEWPMVRDAAVTNTPAMARLESAAFDFMQSFNTKFVFDRYQFRSNGRPVSQVDLSGAYKVVAYKLRPVVKPSIHSVTDMPGVMPFKRVRGGYNLALDVNAVDDAFSIRSLSFTIGDDEDAKSYVALGSNFHESIPTEQIKDGTAVNVQMDLYYRDGIYNGARLRASDPLYSQGLNLTQTVRIDEDAKVFGVLPLRDAFWWWYPTDAFKAVIVWDAILLFVLACIVVWLFHRWFIAVNRYVPSNDVIKLTKI